ncbi:MAG: carboxymuconolactone decarboxylase family protein [Alphaproteobacteria bacterium]
MPRLPALSPQELEELKDDLQLVTENLGGTLPNSMLTLARRPKIMKAARNLWLETVMEPGDVSRGLKWLIAHVVSVSAGCQYCAAHTGENSNIADMPAEKIEAVWDYERSPLFNDGERVALRVAQGAAQAPNAVTDADFEELRKHWDDGQVVEIIATISVFGFFNRWNDTMATELESNPLRFAEEHLSPAGWNVGKHAAE